MHFHIFYIFLFIAIGGVFTALFYKIKNKEKEANLGFNFAAAVSGYFALLAVPAFVYFVLTLPAEIKKVLFGGSVFWLGLVVVFLLLLLLTGFLNFKKKIVGAALLFTAGLVIFVFIRNFIRGLYLKPFAEKFSVVSGNTQYGVMALFFVVLAAGLVLIAYLLVRTARETRSAGSQ